MRRLMQLLDQLPDWTFVLGGAVLLGSFELIGAVARFDLNAGLLDFSRTALFVATVILVLAAIRRRQTHFALAAVQVLAVFAGANLFALAGVWEMVRGDAPASLPTVITAGMSGGVATILGGLPFALLLLWLSRKFGHHSPVTERRLRVVEELRARRAARRAARREG